MAWLAVGLRSRARVLPRLSEAAYRLIASHRTFFYHLTRLTFGKRVLPLKFAKVEWLFLRLLAAIYLIAFASLAVQITGLIGARGILPLGGYLRGCLEGARNARLLVYADHLLAGARRLVSQSGLHRGRGDGDRVVAPGILKASWERLLLVGSVHPVSFALHRRPGFPVVPVGFAAARNRVPGDLSRQLQIRGDAVSMAAVPADVSLRRSEADQPRSGLARLDRSRISLHDAAAAHAARLVHVPVAARVPALLDRLHVVHRTGDSVSVFRAAPLAIRGRGFRAVSASC